MPKVFACIIALFFGAWLPINLAIAKPLRNLDPEEVQKLATDVYVYAYPLVTMELTRRVMTNVVTPDGLRAPMGQFVNAREYPNASFRDVTAPNADTLYSVAWLNLAKEPYVLHVPNEQGRYYLMPMLNGWTDVFASPGTRTTGTKTHDFLIMGPDWKGTLPKGITAFKSGTNLVWVLGRTYCTGTSEDYKIVHALQDQYVLKPLSVYLSGKSYTPPNGAVDSSIDMKTPVRDQVNAMDGATYFKTFADLLKDNPPAAADTSMVTKLIRVGIVPGHDFDFDKLDPVVAKALTSTVKAGQEKILVHGNNVGEVRNGWLFSLKTGVYGTDYLQRAYIAWIGLGANRPQDAIYPKTSFDQEGKPLTGSQSYVIHFLKNQMPPVKGFWSLTMYNDQYFFVDNALNRYSISPRDALKTNMDGSLDLYIQHRSPGKDKESNWLPAPEGNFILMFRFYWPTEAILNGSWRPPIVKRIT